MYKIQVLIHNEQNKEWLNEPKLQNGTNVLVLKFNKRTTRYWSSDFKVEQTIKFSLHVVVFVLLIVLALKDNVDYNTDHNVSFDSL